MAETANPVGINGPSPVLEDHDGGHEWSVLDAAVNLGTVLPVGWRAELEPGNVVLSWHRG
jgi:hypothetical protein